VYTVAVIGATGAVGQELLQLLPQRKFPIKKLICFASPKSAGKFISYENEKIPLEVLESNSFKGVDIAFFCAGKTISKAYAPLAVNAGALVVDNSSAFRLNEHVPLVIPEVNLHALSSHQGIVASPNCTATIMLMALAPLHRQFKIRRIVAATYQAASGAGASAMHELKQEMQATLDLKPFKRTVMPHPYAFNLFTHNAPMTDTGYNEEEVKVIEESRKILEAPELRVAVTCVRVPVLRAHSEALNVAFEMPITPSNAREALQNAPGVTLLEDWEKNRFPMPIDATGKGEIFVGRVRQDLSNPNTLDLWVVGDQLLKGAALNTLQIAEELLTCPTP
jgi:aspartate-semialdehyde dehydrogenase